MLDLIPSVYLAGENQGVAKSMYELMEKFNVMTHNSGSLSWAHRHYHGHRHAMLCSLQAVAKKVLGSIPGSKKVIGWKEIRWTPDSLDFMHELSPCVKFVINVREDVQAQANSGLYNRKDAEVGALKAFTERIENWVATHSMHAWPHDAVMMPSRCSVHCRMHIAVATG